MCAEAKRIVDEGGGGEDPRVLDLFRATPLMQKAVSALGPNVTGWAQPANPKGRRDSQTIGLEAVSDQAPRSCQIAKVGASGVSPSNPAAKLSSFPVRQVSEIDRVWFQPPSDRIGGNGFRMSDLPIFEPSGGPWHAHMDGVWSGGSAPLQSRDEDPTNWLHGPPGNGCPGPNDPHPAGAEVMQHINWTGLVGVALTDQSQPGSGERFPSIYSIFLHFYSILLYFAFHFREPRRAGRDAPSYGAVLSRAARCRWANWTGRTGLAARELRGGECERRPLMESILLHGLSRSAGRLLPTAATLPFYLWVPLDETDESLWIGLPLY